MINRETIIAYMKGIEEELEMNKDRSITSQFMDYMGNMLDKYERLEKYLDTDEDKHKNVSADEIDDDNVIEEQDDFNEYQKYIEYKEKYQESHKQADFDKSQESLKVFLDTLFDIFADIEEMCKDDIEERSLIKNHIKKIYQTFN